MDIIIRNTLTTILNKHFSANMPLEPMSKYKWQEVEQLLHLLDLSDDESVTLPHSSPVCMRNRRLNKRLDSIRKQEEDDNDRAPLTWEYFSLMVYNAELLLGGRIHFSQFIKMSLMLREHGHLIDYLKVEQWLRLLRLTKPASWITSIMTDVFRLTPEEIAYSYKHHKDASRMLYKGIARLHRNMRRESSTTSRQHKSVLLPLTLTPIRQRNGQRILQRRKTAVMSPREAIPLLWHNARRRLDDIEE